MSCNYNNPTSLCSLTCSGTGTGTDGATGAKRLAMNDSSTNEIIKDL